MKQKTIMVCPLNWGLGHATRCMPIIHELLKQKHRIIIASDGDAGILLQNEFPDLEYIELPGYDISYSRGSLLSFSMLFQIPKIFAARKKENRFIEGYLHKNAIDIIISDNRYGLYNESVHSIFITHQLKLKIPGVWKIFSNLISRKMRKWINCYNECWIPDVEASPNLTGDLSHIKRLPANTKFIGPLTRFSFSEKSESLGDKNDVLVILSGPEPQRTELEKKVINQFKELNLKVKIVLGKPKMKEAQKEGLISIIPFLGANDLLNEIQNSRYIIARAGYTTIMDLLFLKKKAILIPTLGQIEQLYLAKHLKNLGCFHFVNQKMLDIKRSITELEKECEPSTSLDFNLYKGNLIL